MGQSLAPTIGSKSERDLRIDFFRGLALIIVLVDHVERMNGIEYVRGWTPTSLGFSDAAEGFIFLSGYVFGMVYGRCLQRDGFLACLRKALRRSAEIYSCYLFITVVVLLFASIVANQCPALSAQANSDAGSSMIIKSALMLSFNFRYPVHNILSFYAVVLPFMVLLLWVLEKNKWIALLTSSLIYLLTQFSSWLTLPAWPPPDEWLFNPFAWQFLFFIGMGLGTRKFAVPRTAFCRNGLAIMALTVVGFGAMAMKGPEVVSEELAISITDMTKWAAIYAEKQHFGVMRAVHFLSASFLLTIVCPASSKMWANTVLRPVVLCGQSSLPVYSVGVLLTFVSIPAIQMFGTSLALVLSIHADAILCSVVVAWLWGVGRRRFYKS